MNFASSSQKLANLSLIVFYGRGKSTKLLNQIQTSKTGMDIWTWVGLLVNKRLLHFVDELNPDKWYVLTVKLPIDTPNINLTLKSCRNLLGLQLLDLEDLIALYSKKQSYIGYSALSNNVWSETFQQKKFLQDTMARLIEKYFYIPHRNKGLSRIFDLRGEQVEALKFDQRYIILERKNDVPKIAVNSVTTPARRNFKLSKKEASISYRRYFGTIDLDTQEKLMTAEFIAKLYSKIGILNKNVDLSNIFPVDFFYDDKINKIPQVTRPPEKF